MLEQYCKLIDKIDDIKILSAGVINAITVGECDFPNHFIKCLHENGIYYIYELQRFGYFQFNDILNEYFISGEYKELLYSIMKKYEINFSDVNMDSLISIKYCGLSARTVSSLTRRGFVYLQDMTNFTRNQVFKTKKFGVKSQKELEEKLIEYGLWYTDEKSD
ncbi:MAG: hypothetical protein NC235_12765 [Clostridiales bacterium]|nr:hypothetical protein [Clostridiales bacterium]